MAIDTNLPPSQSSPTRSSQTLTIPPNNNFPKTLTLASPPQLPPSSKGKSKIEHESMPASDSDSCGICFCEEGKAVRGWIDSCDHYFCFICIMEWSKVESRCPMCKRRFSSIRRSPVDGVFLTERIVNVPVRDQIYHYSGNSTIEPSDRYSDVKCSVCQGTHEENLLLLCDLCDSAAHSFCVGLGSTVPEGDWFCQDCTILKDERSKNETDPEEQVSIFDIAHEPMFTSRRRSTIIPSSRCRPLVIDTQVHVTNNMIEHAENGATQSCARTLRRCRNVQGRIKALRQNWDAFRSGSMSFPTSSVNRPKSNTGGVVSCGGSSQQLTPTKSSSTVDKSRADDIEKAWKMFNAAKLITKGCLKTSTVGSNSKRPFKDIVKDANVSAKLIESSSKKHASEDHVLFGSEKRNQSWVSVKRVPDLLTTGSQVKFSQVYSEQRPSSKDSVPVDVSQNVRDPPKFSSVGATSNISCAQDKNSCNNNKSSNVDDAKSEIQSLVKLNLKLLTRDKKLDVDVFKDVARVSTHSILAACGLESPKRGVRTFTSSVCCHVNEDEQLRKSTLMPSSCRECFFGFVKDVVNTIMIDKLG